MSFTITAAAGFDLDARMETSVSADQLSGIIWIPCTGPFGTTTSSVLISTPEDGEIYQNVTYYNVNTLLSDNAIAVYPNYGFNDVIWCQYEVELGTNVINLTSFSEGITLFISAVNVTGLSIPSESAALVGFTPLYLDNFALPSQTLSSSVINTYYNQSTSTVYTSSFIILADEDGGMTPVEDVFMYPIVSYTTSIYLSAGTGPVTAMGITADYSIASSIYYEVPANSQFSWRITPVIEGTYAHLANDSTIYDLTTTDYISGYSPCASAITVFYEGTSTNINLNVYTKRINDKYLLSPYATSFLFNEPLTEIILNPRIEISVEEANTNFTILSATQKSQPIDSSIYLAWDIIKDYTGVYGLTGDQLTGSYIFGTESANIPAIKLVASDLSNSYQYTLSSYTGTITGLFRPYNEMTNFSVLTASIDQIDTYTNIYQYNIHGFAKTSEIFHNIPPTQYIIWNCDNTSIQAYINNDTSYSFGNTVRANIADTIKLQIIPNVVSTSPKLCSSFIQICALRGENIEDGIYGQYTFNINFNEWLDSNIFDPRFRFQYESENQNTIYREVSASTITSYCISSTSVLPNDSIGYIKYTFDDGIVTVPYSKNNNIISTSAVYHNFDTSVPAICNISMTAYVSSPGFTEYAVREAIPKTIIFTQLYDASKFIIYPEYTWNSNTNAWDQVVSSKINNEGTIILQNTPLSAYSLCHTENFFLSSSVTPSPSVWIKWNIDDINSSNINESNLVNSTTAWMSIKTIDNSTYLSVCASVYNNEYQIGMPVFYYDNPEGVRFRNFATTFDSNITGIHNQHILLEGSDKIGIQASISNIKDIQHPVPNTLYLSGTYTELISDVPFTANINTYYFNISSRFWERLEKSKSHNLSTQTEMLELPINITDIADVYLSVPANEITKIIIAPSMNYTLTLKSAHPSATDWCLNNITQDNTIDVEISAYPMTPRVYTPNKFVVTGVNISFENLVQCFSSVNNFVWTDRNNSNILSSCSPYVTSFDKEGSYDITLKTNYTFNSLSANRQNTFSNIINVQPSYVLYDSAISRVVNFSKINLPNDVHDCAIPPNEWMTNNTFNRSIQKLDENLTYLKNMSNLYDIPPTDYIGWYGTTYYANSVERTRWFTNIPQNSYAYNTPEICIDTIFNNLQSIAVKNNIMYISNGTSVYVISSDFAGQILGVRTYKTLGDDFINIRSIQLDSQNRIYLLDSYNSKNISLGNKNRILVYSFNLNTLQWQLMYEWGGLGGPKAKTKFNGPSDLYIDKNDILWVADSNNKCIKTYTRTGSWLNTIFSEYFTDEEKPISITKDSEDYMYVLTATKILKFDTDNNVIGVFDIDRGAIKINSCVDGGFIYIVYSNKVVKFKNTGSFAGIIAEGDFPLYEKDYRDSYHDEFRNLYIVNKNNIMKYVDLLSIISLKSNTDNVVWSIDDLYVKKDEYIQDWVVNRCFQRLWDNIEVFRRSILGKFGYQNIRTTTRTNLVTTQKMPDDFDLCNYDWLYDIGRIITTDVIYEYEKPIIRSFTVEEYKELPYNKEQIYIGINELHTADVYNRVISKLYDCECILLQMISD